MKSDELNAAIFSNDAEALEQLLKAGIDLNQRDGNGVHPLFHAVNFGGVKTIELLLNHGADINQAGCHGKTPWLLAVESGDLEKISLLRECGADIKAKNDHGQTGLHYAAMRGREDLFNDLLAHAGEEVFYADHRGNTILHLAASWNKPALVKTILAKYSVLIDAQNNDGETVFLKMVKARQFELAETFIAAGCDINLADKQKNYPLLVLVKDFKDEYSKLPLFCIKIVNDHASGIRFLVTASKADCQSEVELQPPPLLTLTTFYNDKKHCHSIIAVTKFQEHDIPGLKLLTTLLDRGSLVNEADIDGNTPLMLSIQAGNEPFVQYLIANGADINHYDKYGKNQLLYAFYSDHYEILALLLALGAELKFRGYNGQALQTEEADKQVALYLFENIPSYNNDKTFFDSIQQVLDQAEGDKPVTYRKLKEALEPVCAAKNKKRAQQKKYD